MCGSSVAVCCCKKLQLLRLIVDILAEMIGAHKVEIAEFKGILTSATQSLKELASL
jgi:hypothetical protein